MHELSIALSLLDLIGEEAERRNCRVMAAHVKLGALSGVVKEALVSAFDLARELTPYSDCRLVIEDVPVIGRCPKCDADRPVESVQWLCCNFCGTPTPEIVSGREMELTAMEIE